MTHSQVLKNKTPASQQGEIDPTTLWDWDTYLEHYRQLDQNLNLNRVRRGKILRVVLYVRVSTDEQARGYSIQEQIIAGKKYAEEKGWVLVEIYIDEGKSGTNARRPAFKRLLRDAKRGLFDTVVVHKLDRFYRDAQGMLRVYADLEKNGVLFVSLTENIDFSTPPGKLMLAVLSVLAEIYVTNLRSETRKGKLGRARKGLWNSSIPFGYCRGNCSSCDDNNGPNYCPEYGEPDRNSNPDILVPHPIESKGVIQAFELYISGRFSDRDITQQLNDYAVQWPDGTVIPLRSKGRNYSSEPEGERRKKHYRLPGEFSKDTVRDMLTRPFYTGQTAYYGSHFDGEKVVKHLHPKRIFDGCHVPIISEDLFFRCQQLRLNRGKAPRGSKGKRRSSRVYPLSGLIFCASDKAPIHSQAGGRDGARRHVCSRRVQKKKCSQVSVKADVLESQIAEMLSPLKISKEWEERILAFMLNEGGLAVLKRQREVVEDNFAAIKEEFEQGELGSLAYRKAWRAYQRRMRELEPEASEAIDQERIRALLSDFERLWSLATPQEQRGLLQTMLYSAMVDNQRLVKVKWQPPFEQLLAGAG